MSDPGPWYILYDSDDKKRRWTADKLRRKIRGRDVAGDELVRLEDEPEEALRPLFNEQMFQEVHHVSAAQAPLIAHANRTRGFLGHAAAFLGVAVFLGWPLWIVFWAIGLFGHFSGTAGSITALMRDDQGRAALLGQPLSQAATTGSASTMATPVATPTATPAPAATVPPPGPPISAATPTPAATPAATGTPTDALTAEARREWKRLETVLDRADERTRSTIEEAKRSLDGLLDRRRELAEHLEGEDAEALSREAEELATDLAVEGLDARTREALQVSLDALEDRGAAAAEARGAADRARARARAFVHQLKSLRLYLVSHAETDAGSDADLGRMVEGIQEQVVSAAELEEALVEARSPSAAARRSKAGA